MYSGLVPEDEGEINVLGLDGVQAVLVVPVQEAVAVGQLVVVGVSVGDD